MLARYTKMVSIANRKPAEIQHATAFSAGAQRKHPCFRLLYLCRYLNIRVM